MMKSKLYFSAIPKENKPPESWNYSDLLDDLNHMGITTQQKLIALIKKHLDRALEEDSKYVAKVQEELKTKGTVHGSSDSRTIEKVKRGIYLNHAGLVRAMLGLKFGERYYAYKRYMAYN